MNNSIKRLTRSRDDRWLGGICGGIGDYLSVDTNLVRLVLAVCTLLGAGTLIIVYVIALILIPLANEHPDSAVADSTSAG